VDLPDSGKVPKYVAHGAKQMKISSFPFMAYDKETDQLVHIPMKEEGKEGRENEPGASQEEQEGVQEENKELLVGRALKVKNRLETHREIKRLEEVHRFEERQYLLQIKGYLYMIKADESLIAPLKASTRPQKERICDLKRQIEDFDPELGMKMREASLAEQDRQIVNLHLLSHLPAGAENG